MTTESFLSMEGFHGCLETRWLPRGNSSLEELCLEREREREEASHLLFELVAIRVAFHRKLGGETSKLPVTVAHFGMIILKILRYEKDRKRLFYEFNTPTRSSVPVERLSETKNKNLTEIVSHAQCYIT